MIAANADVTISELSGRVAPLAVGWMLGPAGAGLYAVAQRATVVLSQPAQILGQAAYAELARLSAGGDAGPRVRAALARAVAIALVATAPVCLAIGLFGRSLAVLAAGPAFAGAGAIMLWLTLARAIQLAGPPMSAALIALGRPGLSVWANLVAGAGLLVLLPPMLDWAGLTGAGLHAILQACVGVCLLAVCVWRETDSGEAWTSGARA
jgi:O-antigen/teichoic acid export membrane protein